MFGTILKYTAVAMVGAVAFTTAAFFTDKAVLEDVEEEITIRRAELVSLETEDYITELSLFAATRRAEWASKMIFASSLEELDDLIGRLVAK